MTSSDLFVGIITQPKGTVAILSSSKLRISIWLVPVSMTIIFGLISYVLLVRDPNIRQMVIAKVIAKYDKEFEKSVQSGKISKN